MDDKDHFSKISGLLTEVLNKIEEAKRYADAGKASQPTANKPNQTETTFDLPWKTYKDKQPAKHDEAGWIFSNNQGAETLLSTLKANNGKTTVGSFEYQLQGAEQQFIGRKPVK
jgi:hypothetical protein